MFKISSWESVENPRKGSAAAPSSRRSGRGKRGLLSALALALALFPGGSIAAAEVEARGEEEAWYVVRPGDTMEGISRRFLGTVHRWRDNWALNPGIRDPNRLQPGQRLRVLVPRQLPEGAALLLEVSRRVEDLARPLDWKEAREQDLLRERDGVRTYEASSAELRLGRDTSVRLSEDSLVFVGREVVEERVSRDVIEVDLGQADLEQMGAPLARGDIEIVVGEARARPSSGDEGDLRSRFRRPDDGGVQVMVYGGASDLSAAGESVAIAAGMGTSAQEGRPPAPPEKLLQPPRDLSPKSDSDLWIGRPRLAWSPVEEAVAYTVEVCEDPDCARLLARETGLEEVAWTPEEDLPLGVVHARVTAVAASGLDGFPSEAVEWRIHDRGDDATAPEVELAFLGEAARMAGRWYVGAATTLQIHAEDPESGIASIEPTLDGRPVEIGHLKGPWEHEERFAVGATVRNGAGRETVFGPVEVVVDDRPPVVVAGRELSDASIYGRGVEASGGGQLEEASVAERTLIWKRADEPFRPLGHLSLGANEGESLVRTERLFVRRSSASREEAIRSERKWKRWRLRRKDRRLRKGLGMWIEVVDHGAGVVLLDLRELEGHRVGVVTTDGVGNETQIEVAVP